MSFIVFADINFTNNPDSSVICKNDVVDLDCGYFVTMATLVFIPSWIINGSTFTRPMIDTNGTPFPLQWLVDSDNNTNTTGLRVGPVGDQFIGNTTFQCGFTSVGVLGPEVILAVIGESPFLVIKLTGANFIYYTCSY